MKRWSSKLFSREAGLGFLAFSLSFCLYLRTMAPTITWRNEGADGGELVAAAYVLGVPHPPGYPLYVLLGRLFAFLPLGDVAWRLNLMSAFFAALAVAITLALSRRSCRVLLWHEPEGIHRCLLEVAAFVSALSLAFSPLFWSQATIAEVHSLSAFLVALTLYCLVCWAERTARAVSPLRDPCLRLAALFYGLSLTHHLSTLMLAPAVLLFVLGWGRRQRGEALDCLQAVSFFLLGLVPYLLLPLLAMRHPPVNWGNACSWSGFLWMLSGGAYRRYVFALPPSEVPGRLSAWASLLVGQFGWWGVALGLLGLWLMASAGPLLAASFLIAFGAVSAYAIGYNTTDSYLYLMPSWLIFAVWLGLGAFALLSALSRLRWPERFRRGAVFVSCVLLLALPFLVLLRDFGGLDLSGDHEAYEYAAGAFRVLEPEAVVIADTDPHTFALWYFAYVVRPHSGVAVLSKGLLEYGWYRQHVRRLYPWVIIPEGEGLSGEWFLEFVCRNGARHPLYLTEMDPVVSAVYRLSVQGPLYRVEVKRCL